MAHSIYRSQTLLRGLLFAALGLGAISLGVGYGVGTATAMGGGYFPVLIGALLAAFGAADIGRALINRHGEGIGAIAVRPLLCLGSGVIGFALLIDSHGLMVAIIFLVGCAVCAQGRPRVLESVAIAAVLCVIAGALYSYGMGFPLVYLIPH